MWYPYGQILGVTTETEAATILWHLPKHPGNVTLSASVFSSPVSLISALRNWHLLCWFALLLLWGCVQIKGFLDITEGSSMLIREAAKPVSFQDVPFPCSHSLHGWIITGFYLILTPPSSGAAPASLPKTCLCHKSLQGYLSPCGLPL